MAAEWFYQAKGQESGPVDSRELRRLAEAGIVRPDTLVRKGVSGNWIRAETVSGLFGPSEKPTLAEGKQELDDLKRTSGTNYPTSEANMQKQPKHMNKAQRIVIVVGIVLILGMGVFPPWRDGGHCGGYGLLFAPPSFKKPEDFGYPRTATGIDVSRLLIQCVLVGAATAGVVVGIRVWSDPRR